jgi:hypothetical protein
MRLKTGKSAMGSSRNSVHCCNQFLFIITGKRYITTFRKLPTIKPIMVMNEIKKAGVSSSTDISDMIGFSKKNVENAKLS